MAVCGACTSENRDGARYCAVCGAILQISCPACGAVPARAAARFCDECGSPLPGSARVGATPAEQSRKVVTIVFADLVGSTSAQEGADPEAVRRWVDRYNVVLRREVEARGGRVAKFTGDGVMAVFGIPEVREDDARRALEAAFALHTAVADLGGGAGAPERVALRIGVNTGEVVVSPDDDDVVGDVVNVAARLQTAAAAGEVLVGEATFRLVRLGAQLRALPPLDLRGKAAPVNAFRLLSLARGEDTVASPFVGRVGELGRLLAVVDSCVAERHACLVSIAGAPGVGKTRLARELAAAASDRVRVVEVRCEAVGGATFAPIAAALRQAASLEDDATPETVIAALTALFDDDEPDRERVAAGAATLLGVGEPGLPEETFWAVRRLVENAARRGPIMFLFDDVHWAEPLLLDLIENIAEWTRGVPVVLVVTARPELRDLRPRILEAGGRVSAAVHLEGLAADESRRLTSELVGGAELPEVLLDRVVTASEGNPLFVRELVRMLVDDGALERVGASWRVTVDLEEIEVPLTISALLAARIDRLAPGERAVLEAASVVGKTFYRGGLAALLPAEVVAHLDDHLEGLRRKELVEPAGTYWLDEPVLRFHHVLMRDAAYRRLLKETRASLHERAAHWLEVKVGDLPEHDDAIGYQLEQAHHLRAEAGEPHVALGRAAADRLGAAGRRALDADDRPVAASLLGRALRCLPDDAADRGVLLIDRCEALLAMGDATEAAGAVDELARLAAGSPRLEAWAACFAGELANLRDAGALAQTAVFAEVAAVQLADLGDAAGEAKAYAVRAASLARLGRIAECESSLDRALAAARRAGDRRRATAILAGAPVAALWGPTPVTQASGRCLDVVRLVRITGRAPAVEATSLRCQAVLEALRGHDAEAGRMLASARRSLEELGHEHGLLEVDLAAGMVELLADRSSQAAELLQRAHEGFHLLGVDVDAGLAAALLARARLTEGEAEEALELTIESEKLGGDDLKTSIAWRAVRAEALAQRGELEAAVVLAEAAVELAARTDALLDHADALVASATVLHASGDLAGASERSRAALELYQRKEATAPAARAAALLGNDRDDARIVARSGGGSGVRALRDNRAASAMRSNYELFLAGDPRTRSILHDDMVAVDNRALVGGVTVHGGDGFLDFLEGIRAVGVVLADLDLVAVRGERLCLFRAELRGAQGAVPALQLCLVSEEGQLLRSELFDVDQLREATRRLDELGLAPDEEGGRLDDRHLTGLDAGAAQTWRAVRALYDALNAHDVEALAAAMSERVLVLDHPPGERGPTTGDEVVDASAARFVAVPDAWWAITTVHEVTDGAAFLSDEVGGAREGDASAVARTVVLAVDDGRVAEVHTYPVEHRAAAEVRFAELAAGSHLENLASRAVRAGNDVALAGSWEAVADGLDPDVVLADRRPLYGGITVKGAGSYVEFVRSVFRTGVARVGVEVQAQRGDSLALVHVVHAGPTASLATEQVVVVDGAAHHILRHEVFEPGQLREAISVLDGLYAETLDGEAAAAWEVYRGVTPAVSAPGSIFESSPDSWWMTRRVLGLRRGVVYTWCDLQGSRDGSSWTVPMLQVVAARDGELASVNVYAPQDRAAADARFAQLAR